jgi:SAM-dependent methyltransferase
VSADEVPASVKARISAFAAALDNAWSNTRLMYFRELVTREGRSTIDNRRSDPAARRAFLSEQYVRAMRFLYEQEFAAKGRPSPVKGELYQERGLSTDTSVDACYVVYLALATLRRLEPHRRIQHVLIIGPGLDLAPRTGLVETGAPQSYQPFAVMDALFSTGLAEPATLRLTAIDINPRVVDWLRGAQKAPPQLTLFPGISEARRVRMTEDYRSYFASLGQSVGVARRVPGLDSRRLAKTVQLSSSATAAVDSELVDITVERVEDRYDLIVVTNVFPYLSDPELLLGVSNIVRMLKPGGILMHNEPRPLLADAALALRLPLIHSRSAVVATVERGVAPLYDSIWMHKTRD